jgi:opacity protein-like surface antigen
MLSHFIDRSGIKILAVIALLGVLALPHNARAQTSRLYFAGYLGVNMAPEQDYVDATGGQTGTFGFSNATEFAGALGVRVNRQLRFEAEAGFTSQDFANADIQGTGEVNASGKLDRSLYLINAYYDLDVPWTFTPYVGAGAGLARFDGKIDSQGGTFTQANDSTTVPALQLGGGLKYRLRPDLALTGGYRYVTTSDLDIGSYDIEYDTHEFRVGLEWDFPVR